MSKKFSESAFVPFANTICETRDLWRLFDQIANVERFLFRGKEGTIAQKASDYLPSNLAAIFSEIEKAGLEPQGDQQQKEFLAELVLYLKLLPQVKITLAFEPTNSFVTALNSDISNQIGQKAVLDVCVNQYIMGGAIFEYKGKVLKDTLEERLNTVVAGLTAELELGRKKKT